MQHLYRHIHANPKFHELERKRSRLSWTLAAIVLANVCWYILATAFYPEVGFALFWGKPLVEGGATTWGIVIGFWQTVLFIALVVYYIWKANGELDALKEEVVADALRAAEKQA